MKMKIIFLSLLSLVLFGGCARKQENNPGKLSLNFEWLSSTNRAKSVSTLALTPTAENLQRVMINVSGSDFAQIAPEPWNRRSSYDSPPTFYNVLVPRGSGRLIQVLLVFGSDSNFIFYYGESVIDVQSDIVDASISTEPAGAELGEGQVAGRFLDATGNGPTGQLIMRFKPPTGQRSMIVDVADIYAGWFSVFALQNQAFDYTLEDGSMLFSNLTTNNMTANGNSVLKAYMPPYYSCDGGDTCTTRKSRQNKKMILGWFGPGSANKNICYPNGRKDIHGAYADATSSTYRSWNGNAPVIAEDSTGQAGVIEGGIGVLSYPTDSCGSTAYSDHLFFDSSSITNGDRTLQFSGPYKPVSTGANSYNPLISTSFSAGTYTLTWSYLPDTDKAQYPSQKSVLGSGLFYKINTTGMHDDHHDLECNNMQNYGFQLINDYERNTVQAVLTPADLQLDSTTFSNYINSGNIKFALCPYFATAGYPRYFNRAISIYGGGGNYGGGGGPSGGGGGYYSGGTPTKLAINGPGVLNVSSNGTACIHYEIELQDSTGYMAGSSYNTSGITVTLLATGGTLSDSCNTTSYSSINVTVPANSNSVSFYYRPGTATTTGSSYGINASSTTLTSTVRSITLVAEGQPTQVEFVKSNANTPDSDLNYVLVGTCTAVYLKAVDSNHSPANSASTLSFSVSLNNYNNNASLYSDPSCNTSLSNTTVSIPASNNFSNAFYIRASSSGWINLNAQETSLGIGGHHGLQAGVPGQAVMFDITSTNQYLNTSSCELITITPKDATLATVSLGSSDVSINLYAESGSFYSNASCSSTPTSNTTISLTANATSVSGIYFKPNYSNSSSSVHANTEGNSSSTTSTYVYGYKWFENLAKLVAYPANGITYDSQTNSFSGQTKAVMEGESFQVKIEARSSQGNLITSFNETSFSALNLRNQYEGYTCNSISWNSGIGTANCQYTATSNFFSTALLNFVTGGNSPSNYPYYNPTFYPLRVLRKGETSSVIQSQLSSHSFSYSLNQCQPLLFARGLFISGYGNTLGYRVTTSYTASLPSASGVSSFHSSQTDCASGTPNISQVSLGSNESAKIIYARFNGSTPSGIQADSSSLWNYTNSTSTAMSNASPSTFNQYRVSMATTHFYGGCSPVMIVRTDTNGAAISVGGSAESVNLSSDFASWHSDSTCSSTSISSTTIAIGDSATLVYIQSNTPNNSTGTVTVTNGSQSGSVSILNTNIQAF